MRRRYAATPIRYLLLGILLVWPTALAAAGGQPEQGGTGSAEDGGQDIDHVAIAAVMIRDGNYGRAEDALAKADPDAEGVDVARYYTLKGLLHLRTAEYQEAVDSFNAAIENGQDDSSIYAYLAQGQNALGNHAAALEALAQVPNLTRFPGLFALKASSEWQLEKKREALETLRRAEGLFPSRSDFPRQRIVYLMELNLTQAAAAEALAYLKEAEQEPDVYVAIGEALRRGGQLDAAVQVLEIGRVRFPQDEQVKLALAQAYLSKEMPRTAGAIIEEAAAFNLSLYHEAAEIYRRAGDLTKALFLNSQVVDSAKKTRQRFNLLLALERYEEAVALEPRLASSGAAQEDSVRYALAYAYFQNRNLTRAVEYLSGISSSEYFQRSTRLRRAIETVRDQEFMYF